MLKKINTALLLLLLAFSTKGIVSASTINDSIITTEVKANLLQEQDIPKDIEVKTNGGIVSLKGNVDTNLQANRAIEIASGVDNVIDVIDTDLKVKHSNSIITDSVITAKVKGKIRHLVYIKLKSEHDLHVETTNQVVHIFGTVDKNVNVDSIVAVARDVKGVKSVRTNIKHSN